MIFIYDRDEKQIAHLDIIPKITEEIGKLRTLEFESEIEFEKGFRVVADNEDRKSEFIIRDVDYEREETKVFSYFCQCSFIENESVPILDKRPSGDLSQVLTTIFSDTRWIFEVRSTDTINQNYNNSFYHINALEAFAETVEKYKVEWITEFKYVGSKITERRVVIYRRDGRSKGRLEFGKNIKKFSRKILSEPIVTALYPYGKGEDLGNGTYGRRIGIESVNDGIPYIENKQATDLYGIGEKGSKKPLFAFITFEEETDPTNLKKEAQKELDILSQIRAEHTVEAINLDIDAKIGYEVAVIDEEISYRGYSRIIKLVRQGDDVEVTFGQVTKAFTDTFQKTLKKTEQGLIEVFEQVNIIRTSANGKTDVFTGPTKPANANEGDIWYRYNADGTVDLLNFVNGEWVEELSEKVFKELRDAIEANNQLVTDAKSAADAASTKVDTEVAKVNQSIVDLTKDLNDSITEVDTASKNNYGELTGKVTDLTTALANKPDKTYVDQTIDEKTGTITTTLGQIETKVNELDAVPVYTIGADGYWHKDGVKTSTLAVGKDGKSGVNGANFTWNLIKNSKANVVSSNNNATVPITFETLTENDNPFVRIKRINTTSQPTKMSLYSNFYFNRIDKMYANKRYTFSFEARASHEATAEYWSQYRDRVAEEKTTTISSLSTTIANKNMGLTTAWDTFSITFTMPNDTDEKDIIILAPIVTIPEGEIDNFYLDLRNWKLEEGANINPTWSPHKSETIGKAGVDGNSFQWNLIKNGSLRDYVDTSLWAITRGTDYKTNSEYTRINVTEYKKDNQFFYSLVGLLESGKTYTMSADVYIESYSEGVTNAYLALYNSGYYLKDTTSTWFTYGSVKPNVKLLNQWQTIYHTFTVDEKFNTITSYNLMLYFRDIVGAIRWKNVQLKESNVLTDWSPHQDDIQGADGKDAMFVGATPPTDTTIAWLDTNTNSVKRFYNGAWYDINTEIKTKLNTVVDTVDTHTRTIAQVNADLKNRVETSTFSTFKQEYDKIVSTVQKTETDLSGLRESTTTKLNEQKQTLDANISKISNIEKDLTSGTTYQKIQTIKQTADGNLITISSIEKDLNGETGNASLTTIRQSLDSFTSQFAKIPSNIASTVKVDEYGIPIPPYEINDIWIKDAYDFTQRYDIFDEDETKNLQEFLSEGVWISKVNKLEGEEFNWDDWKKVSADAGYHLTTIEQDINQIMLVTQKGDLISAINIQAGRVLMSSGDSDGKSRLMLSKEGTYIDNALIETAHIKDAAITTAKIGDAQIDTAKIADLAVTSAKILNLDVNKISGNVSEFIKSKWNAINSNLTVDGNQLVFSHTDGTKTVLDATGLYTRDGASKYMHSYLTYANHYLKLNAPVTAPVWVTLPPVWKGRKFDVFVSIASTAGMNALGNESVIRNISVGHLGGTKDYVNGRFQLYGICEYYNTATKAKGNTWVDVRYLVQQIF